MEIHAEYFLKCNEAAKWLNTPQPVAGVPKEFLDGAHAITSNIASISNNSDPHFPLHPPFEKLPKSKQNGKSHLSTSPSPCSSVPLKAPPSADAHPRTNKSSHHIYRRAVDGDITSIERGFPSQKDLHTSTPFGCKSLLYVPVELYDHFVFGIVVGCPVPPPDHVDPKFWIPLVTRFVLDAGRRCCLMFSYFAEGSIVVQMDCFNELGDHFSEITFFEPTPVVGVFPRGIRGRMQISEKRDCPKCAAAFLSCACPVNERVDAIVALRQKRVLMPEHGPAHAGSSYKDDNVIIQTYPYWAQVLDEYMWSRTGSYCVQIQYSPAGKWNSEKGNLESQASQNLAYRCIVNSEPRVTVDKMLRVYLFEKGVSALKPPATDVRWETSSTISVNADNQIISDDDPVMSVCFTDWHKLPGFQEDYLLVAPSNIVSDARARAELARAEAERLAARSRVGVPVLPSWASGRNGVFEHILNESGPELDGLLEDYQANRSVIPPHIHSSLPIASAGTVMRMKREEDKPGTTQNSPRSSLEGRKVVPRRQTAAVDSNTR